MVDMTKLRAVKGEDPLAFDPMVRCIPSVGWIARYLDWTEESEPPTRFRFATALALVSTMLNRQVYMPFGNMHTFPNLWILLMGPPGCGKDTAINQGYNLFNKLHKKPKVIAEKITPEALVKVLASVRMSENGDMQQDCKGVVFAPELSTFLGRARYNEGMITLLTRLYDCPPEMPTETIIRQNITLHNVCLNMLWGSTQDWYTRYMPEGAMCGGFLSRIFFMFYIKREKKLPNPPTFDYDHETRLLIELDEIGKMEGEMTFVEDAKSMFEEWYMKMPDPVDHETVPGYTFRKPLMVKKLSMILSASESRDMHIREHHVLAAINIVEISGDYLTQEVDKMAASPASQQADYFAHVIGLKPEGMLRREVMQRVYRRLEGQRDIFDKVIDFLLQLGKIEQYRDERDRICYRKKKYLPFVE